MNNKKEKEPFTKWVDRAISDLVYEKVQLIKAYNYYHGKRDPEQFRHLEENYGIGTPTSVEFIPLVRKHIDVLVGEYLSTPVTPKVSCKDKETLSNIHKDKQVAINKAIRQVYKQFLQKTLYYSKENNQPFKDPELVKRIEILEDTLDRNFISDYEIAGQNIIEYSMQSRNIDFINKRKMFLLDLLIGGIGYYRISPSSSDTSIDFSVLNPLDTFVDKNVESIYLKNSPRAVIRTHLTKQQILEKYGKYLSEDEIKELESLEEYSENEYDTTYLRTYDNPVGQITDGILGGFEVTPMTSMYGSGSKYFRTLPVYEIERLVTEKEKGKYITHREQAIRIGHNIYINLGRDNYVTRSMEDPTKCTLSINGIFYTDRNGDPFSLILSTANLQDKFDCLHFYRDNVIAESGSVGDWIDVAHLPKFLGETVTERLIKWKAYKKTGMALYDSSQEGQALNTSFGGFDDTIKVQTIQAIELAIQRTEETCSTITGVFKERLGGIEQRDAVTNVQVGIVNSSHITKQYYQLMDLMTREILMDILDLSKIVYKKGISGTIVLGERLNKVFTAESKHYTMTSYDVHIADSSEIIKEQETIKQLIIELIKGQMIDSDVAVEAMTTKSLTKMKEVIARSMGEKKAENSQMTQLSQQVQEYERQLKEAMQKLEKYEKEIEKNDSAKTSLEREKLEHEKSIGWFKAKSEDDYRKETLEYNKQRVQLEGLQLLDHNPNNDEVRDN